MIVMMMMTMMVMTNHLQVVSWPHLLHASTSTNSQTQSSNLSLTQSQPGPATDGVDIKCGQKNRSGQTEDNDLDGEQKSTGESNLRKELILPKALTICVKKRLESWKMPSKVVSLTIPSPQTEKGD